MTVNETIPLEELDRQSFCFADRNGTLFKWNGMLLRGLTGNNAGLYRKCFANGLIEELVANRLLVESNIENFAIFGYDLVVKHKNISPISYAFEWSPLMLRDAALAILNLNIELTAHGLCTIDAHPFNVLFDGPNPKFIDFSSIIENPIEQGWPAYSEFCHKFLSPLQLVSLGFRRAGRTLFYQIWDLMHKGEIETLNSLIISQNNLSRFIKKPKSGVLRLARNLGTKALPSFILRPLRKSYNAKNRNRENLLKNLKDKVEALEIPFVKTEWSPYYDQNWPDFNGSENWTEKHANVFKMLKETRPQRVLDIGSNKGWYSLLAALKINAKVTALDVDDVCIDELYQKARSCQADVLPLVVDITNPSPGMGLMNDWFPPATKRLRSDMVISLALVHHLVFKKYLKFDQIAKALNELTEKILIVEFVSPDDEYVRKWITPHYEWYCIEGFVQELIKLFSEVLILNSNVPERKLVVAKKAI